jgi:hypothetical protein
MKVERHRRLKCSTEEREVDNGARNICSLSSGAACSLEWLAMGILKFSVANKGPHVDSTDGSGPQSMQSTQHEYRLSGRESHGKCWPFLQVIVFPEYVSVQSSNH